MIPLTHESIERAFVLLAEVPTEQPPRLPVYGCACDKIRGQREHKD
jgi:hypothetical protein